MTDKEKLEKLKAKYADMEKHYTKRINDLENELTRAAEGKGIGKKALVEVTIDGQYALVTRNVQQWMMIKAKQCEELFNQNVHMQKMLGVKPSPTQEYKWEK